MCLSGATCLSTDMTDIIVKIICHALSARVHFRFKYNDFQNTLELDNIGMVSFYMRFIWMRLRNRGTARLCRVVPLFRAEYK